MEARALVDEAMLELQHQAHGRFQPTADHLHDEDEGCNLDVWEQETETWNRPAAWVCARALWGTPQMT